jgi:quinoprotein glucose dehydrogenase
VDGRRVKAVAQVTKQSLIFVFDRVTGKPIWPIEERPVPQSDVPGEKTSPTQPFPTKPAPFQPLGVTVDDLVVSTPEIRAMAVEAIRGYRYGPLYTPPSVIVKGGNKGTLIRPSANGGANWGGAGVDPETGILYVPSRETLEVHSIQAPETGQKTNLRFVEARGVPLPRMPEGLPLFKPPYSRMTAIDMNKGEHIWMVPLGNGDAIRNHPMLKDLHLPPLGGDANLTGPLVTKTLLISALLKGDEQRAKARRA